MYVCVWCVCAYRLVLCLCASYIHQRMYVRVVWCIQGGYCAMNERRGSTMNYAYAICMLYVNLYVHYVCCMLTYIFIMYANHACMLTFIFIMYTNHVCMSTFVFIMYTNHVCNIHVVCWPFLHINHLNCSPVYTYSSPRLSKLRRSRLPPQARDSPVYVQHAPHNHITL